MLTYKLWEIYIDENWYKSEYDFSEVVLNVLEGFLTILFSFVAICLDIIGIPIYIVAFIIWLMRGCE